jgi:hypothetical protein
MREKRKIAVLLIVVMSLTLVVGCSSDDDNSVEEKGILEIATDIPANEAYDFTELNFKVYNEGDFGGQVLKSRTITDDLSGTKGENIKLE